MAIRAHLVNYTCEYFSMTSKTLPNFAYVVTGAAYGGKAYKKLARTKSLNLQYSMAMVRDLWLGLGSGLGIQA